ncbi:hypothetical protein SAMN05421853_11032 [Roseivivax halotolerans]|jgi:hypothetical protein|uniref:Uncharacterized protein n=1 Tax=Roseivivax halotolerans TaxID=93684 RepID=A0A1I5ZH87_9RHOB|nr:MULTISPECIES: hypothetical protein [Roseivivax]QFT62544.1 hypothetical protein FIU91_06360 [Roseivivax sp. THAF30]SFQ55844.1 hypothetical protein SAMN05421853_11032 [Roseivivax halotolerans]
MEQKPPQKGSRDTGREDRLKAALKANLARRKRQAKAREDDAPSGTDNKD